MHLQRVCSFYSIYFELVQRQPTKSKLRQVMQHFLEDTGVKATLSDVQARFPSSSRYLVERMFTDMSYENKFYVHTRDVVFFTMQGRR